MCQSGFTFTFQFLHWKNFSQVELLAVAFWPHDILHKNDIQLYHALPLLLSVVVPTFLVELCYSSYPKSIAYQMKQNTVKCKQLSAQQNYLLLMHFIGI